MAALPLLPDEDPQIVSPIGCFAGIGRDRLGAGLLRFAESRPEVTVGVHELGRCGLIEGLRTGELALAVMPGEPDPAFRSSFLWEERALVALPPAHPLAGTDVAPVVLERLLFLASRRQHGGALHRFLAERLLGGDAHLSTDMRDCGMGRLLEAVAGGEGVALVTASHAELARRAGAALCEIVHPRARFPVHALWSARPSEPALARLVALLRERSR